MSNDLTKKAAEMLLKGATLLKEPCPYCSGVRVMKDGNAFCISCGSHPDQEKDPSNDNDSKSQEFDSIKIFEKKLETLTREFENESDHEKQQSILQSINSLLETIEKLKSRQ